jgi:hypothetical protein
MAGMDDDLKLSLGDREPNRPRRRWEGVEARLDEAAHDSRFNPYDGPRRPVRKPRPILAIFLIGVAVFCIAFAVAPLLAFRAVRSAAEFGDVKALAELVDYNAVRESLRDGINPAAAARPPVDLLHDPIGALRRALEPAAPQANVEPYLSPESLASLSEGRGLRAPKQAPASGLFGGPIPAVRYWGFDRTRLGVADPAGGGRETIFTFQRRKLFDWRLVGIRPPQAAP